MSSRDGAAGDGERRGLAGRLIRSPTLWWGLALGVLALRAAYSLGFLAEAGLVPGPNSLGEAGKVYFAAEVAEGRWPFATAEAPPHYPSIHGFLLHAVVGGFGALAGLERTELYYAGRAVSAAATLAAFGLFWGLARRTDASRRIAAFGLLLWAGSHAIFQHATSYRPDNWLLALSLLCCWLVAVPARSRRTLAILAVVPVAAFHVKATGLALGAAVVAGLWHRHDGRTAAAVAGGQAVLLAASVAGLGWLSGGEYLAGLGAAGSAGFSPAHALSSLWTATDPAIAVLVAAPLLAGAVSGRRLWRDETAAVAGIFWAVILGSSLLAAARAGSNAYYFLEPAAYGALVGAAALERLRRSSEDERPSTLPLAAGVLVGLLPAAANLGLWITVGPAMEGVGNHSLQRTEAVGEARLELARRLNADGLSCFADDPGLNVLLEEPRVIYPYLQSQMMAGGALPADLRARQIRERSYDCVVISGSTWSYQGTTALPESFFEAVREHYPREERFGPYRLLRPPEDDRIAASVSASAVRDSKGDRVGTAVVIRDIRQRKALEEQLRHRALHDPLTDLPNRALYEDRLSQLLRLRARPESAGDLEEVLGRLLPRMKSMAGE